MFSGKKVDLYLSGFSPNEKIRLFAYKVDELGKFLGWDEFQVNGSGELLININERCENISACNYYKGYEYVIVGEVSGEVHDVKLAGIMDILSSNYK